MKRVNGEIPRPRRATLYTFVPAAPGRHRERRRSLLTVLTAVPWSSRRDPELDQWPRLSDLAVVPLEELEEPGESGGRASAGSRRDQGGSGADRSVAGDDRAGGDRAASGDRAGGAGRRPAPAVPGRASVPRARQPVGGAAVNLPQQPPAPSAAPSPASVAGWSRRRTRSSGAAHRPVPQPAGPGAESGTQVGIPGTVPGPQGPAPGAQGTAPGAPVPGSGGSAVPAGQAPPAAGRGATRGRGPTEAQIRRLKTARTALREAPHRIDIARCCTEAARDLVDAERVTFVVRLPEGPRVALEDPPGTGTLEGWGPVLEQAPWEGGRARRTLVRDDPLGMYEDLALVTAPVLARGRAAGAILARRGPDRPFTDGDVDALARLGRLAGSALDILARRTGAGTTVELEPVTGVGSDQRLLADVRQAVTGGGTVPVPLALVIFGIDRVADTRALAGPGPAAEVLRQAILTVRGELRAGDVLYRLGVDELAVLLPGTAAHEVGMVAGRLHADLVQSMGGVIGVGHAMVRRESSDRLVDEARQAMVADRDQRRRLHGAASPV